MMRFILVWAYAGLVIALSFVSFLLYFIDKRRAGQGGRRIPERTLHLLAACGGWPGALAGQRCFRHKTQKLSFRIVFWLLVVLHVAMAGMVAYLLYVRV